MHSRIHAAVVICFVASLAVYCGGLGLALHTAAGWQLATEILPGGLPKNQPGQKPGSYG
jgi:hypothetical protein